MRCPSPSSRKAAPCAASGQSNMRDMTVPRKAGARHLSACDRRQPRWARPWRNPVSGRSSCRRSAGSGCRPECDARHSRMPVLSGLRNLRASEDLRPLCAVVRSEHTQFLEEFAGEFNIGQATGRDELLVANRWRIDVVGRL